MKKLILSLTPGIVAAGIIAAAPAQAAQGGFDHSGSGHAWMKVGADELRGKTADRACVEALRGDGPECNHLVVLVVSEKMQHPDAAGYWAEWYPSSGQTRSGTW